MPPARRPIWRPWSGGCRPCHPWPILPETIRPGAANGTASGSTTADVGASVARSRAGRRRTMARRHPLVNGIAAAAAAADGTEWRDDEAGEYLEMSARATFLFMPESAYGPTN